MRITWILAIVSVLLLSCNKCPDSGYYIAPMNISITSVPIVRLSSDTVSVKITIPHKAKDVRSSSVLIPEATMNKRPFDLSFSFGGIANDQVGPGEIFIDPVKLGYFKLQTIKGIMSVERFSTFGFEKHDTAWQIHFQLIPQKRFNGLFVLHFYPTGYRDRCIELGLQQTMINTPQSHNLVKERLALPFEPHPSDIFFYVE